MLAHVDDMPIITKMFFVLFHTKSVKSHVFYSRPHSDFVPLAPQRWVQLWGAGRGENDRPSLGSPLCSPRPGTGVEAEISIPQVQLFLNKDFEGRNVTLELSQSNPSN